MRTGYDIKVTPDMYRISDLTTLLWVFTDHPRIKRDSILAAMSAQQVLSE